MAQEQSGVLFGGQVLWDGVLSSFWVFLAGYPTGRGIASASACYKAV